MADIEPEHPEQSAKIYSNKHHRWWPSADYVTDLELSFRNHPLNIEEIDIELHETIHEYSTPPNKPPEAVMRAFLEKYPLDVLKQPEPAKLMTLSLSPEKETVGVVFVGELTGMKHVLTIRCRNSCQSCFFSPEIGIRYIPGEQENPSQSKLMKWNHPQSHHRRRRLSSAATATTKKGQ